jgi:hypothetical protein
VAGTSHTDSGGTSAPGGDDGFHLLVVTTTDVPGNSLRQQVEEHADGRDPAVHVVAPAITEGPLKHVMGDVDDAKEDAGKRLDASLDELRSSPGEVTGMIGDSDPLIAIEDALQTFPADEILIVTQAGDGSRWLEGDLFERAKEKFEPPLTHVTVEGASGDADVGEVEHRGRGAESPDEAAADPTSGNLPPFSGRDLFGLLVAIIGTLVLGFLAATCDSGSADAVEHGSGTSAECSARILIAVGVALINAAHIVGLFLFQGLRYRGGWARLFATLSLVLTPIAIVASLLIH